MNRRFLPWIALALVVVAVVVAMVVRGVARGPAARGPSRIPDVVDLAPPAAITPEERASAATGLDPQPSVTLEAGAWVEVADPRTGRLAQRYSSTQVEPLPDRQVRMQNPRASFHAQSGRVVTLEGDRATAQVPKRALQSGVIEGNVVIRLFQPDSSGRVSLDRDLPALEVHAPEAAFDAEVGHLRCDHEVEIVTPAVRFRGENLTLILDDAGDAPERVIVERALEPLRVDLARLDADAAGRRARGDGGPGDGGPGDAARAPTRGTTAPPAPSGTASGGRPSEAPATAAPSGPAATTSSPAPSAIPAPVESGEHRFYRLTFHDDVHVVRTRDGVESTIDGHTLSLVFSLDAEQARRSVSATSFGPALAFEPAAAQGALHPDHLPHSPTAAPAQLAGTLVTLLVAADPPTEDVLTITYSGRLVMVPDPDGGRALTSPDDVRIEVAGKPGPSGAIARRVEFADPSQSLRGHCHALRFNTLSKRLELDGSADDPVDVQSARFSILSPEVRVAAGGGAGSLGGPGRITIRDQTQAAAGGEPLFLAAATLDDASLQAIAASLPGQVGGAAADGRSADQPRIPLEILWEDGVDLTFAPPEGNEETGGLRAAAFRGDVRVVGEDFAMRSDRLTVGFAGGGGQEQSLSSIDAVGMVQVRRLGESATMDAQELSMTLEQVEGRSSPRTLAARGGVSARDANRTILAETLDVTFKPKAPIAAADAPAADPPAVASTPRDASSLGEQIGTVDIATVLANRDVRVQLEDGARVYADRLEGDSIAGALALLADAGGEVLIVRDKVVADRMKEVRFDDANRTAHAEGPGRFRFFAEPVAMPPLQSRERPQAMERPALEAAWTGAFNYDDRAGTASDGEITLTGDVNVRTEPRPEELDTITAKELVLGLVSRPGSGQAGIGQTGGEPPAGGEPSRTLVAGSKDIATLRATGGAELQAQRWADGQRAGMPPQVFRVRGESLEYDLRTREAAVRSAGDLLVHDVTPGNADTASAVSTFGSKGTSNFSWKGGMEMRRDAGSADRYLITLADEVEVLHGGLRREDELALTCDRLEVTVDRPDPHGGAQVVGKAAEAGGGLDVGGDARLVRIRGVGGVLVETKSDAEQVSCHEFDYNVATGIATMRARPGDLVQAMVKGGFAPMRAASMRWDMREGRLQILGAAADVGR